MLASFVLCETVVTLFGIFMYFDAQVNIACKVSSYFGGHLEIVNIFLRL